jgi:hypothetical protein
VEGGIHTYAAAEICTAVGRMRDSPDASASSVLSSEYIFEYSFFHSPSKAAFALAPYLDQCNLSGETASAYGGFCFQ